jgi:hypothetical protein
MAGSIVAKIGLRMNTDRLTWRDTRQEYNMQQCFHSNVAKETWEGYNWMNDVEN